MNKIKLLDCTLRDGGYVNDWKFGHRVICDVINELTVSGVEYIECGYLSQMKGGNLDKTQFASIEDLLNILPGNFENDKYTLMINYGEFDEKDLPLANADSPIIRVCFHKKDNEEAIRYCNQIIQKGYLVFVQPMASLNYSDVEFIEMIEKVNSIHPAGFYIVDSFGGMELKAFQRLLSIADHNLNIDIILGYHSHNNLQQAYENAKYFVRQKLNHDILLDASVYGMGRGAGNLNMELFASYLNKNYDKSYNIDKFLDIMDKYIKPIFSEHYWGYSLPYYLSAQYNCHPNYAGYFSEKNTLTNKSMRQLLASLPEDVKVHYSREMAEKFYLSFQKNLVDDECVLKELKEEFGNKEVLILATGKSIYTEKDKINNFIEEKHPVKVGINSIPAEYQCNYLMCCSEKRFDQINVPDSCRLILSSNLIANRENLGESMNAFVINYSSYLMDESLISDNPTLMFIQLCINIGVKKVFLVGFDGYSPNPRENYYDDSLSLGTSIDNKIQKNNLIRQKVQELAQAIDIEFITSSMYQ
jgi:4-hydroxy 2-oxovalerate aldolase